MAKETDPLLDHNFDGIQEYDNPLPRWWQGLFYGTILFSLIYFPYYTLGLGPSSAEMYEEEMAIALKAQPEQVARDTEQKPVVGVAKDSSGVAQNGGGKAAVSLEGNAEAVAAGKTLFATSCMPCHGDKGQGVIGPNLADNYWIHGNSYNDVVRVISNGVPDKGMIPWKSTLNPTKIGQVAAFVLSLKGTNPPNPKTPQGKEYPE